MLIAILVATRLLGLLIQRDKFSLWGERGDFDKIGVGLWSWDYNNAVTPKTPP